MKRKHVFQVLENKVLKKVSGFRYS